jgi:hypothetical protein
MLDYRTSQLKTILLLKHLNGLNAVWEEQVVYKRICELETEYAKTQEYQELTAEQHQLFHRLFENADPKGRQPAD